MEDYLLTVTEVSKRLKTTPHFVYKLIDQGLLVGLKLGHLKVRNEEVNRFLKDMHGKDVNSMIGGELNEAN